MKGIPLKKWEWSFNDGNGISFADTSYPTDGVVEHLYEQPGYYYPFLKVTDEDGCYNFCLFIELYWHKG